MRYDKVDAGSHACTKNKVQLWRWWEDYAHLVKQAQKPNVNRKTRWEEEEEEGISTAHIPVNKYKSLSGDREH